MTKLVSADLVVVPEINVEVAGAVVYWRLSGSIPADVLADSWRAAGLPEDRFPKKPDRATALRRAVKDMVDNNVLVRTTPEGSWVFVQETFESDRPAYQTALYAFATPDGLTFSPGEVFEKFPNLQKSIETGFSFYLSNFTASDISMWLVSLAETYGAVPLRDSGGIYFVPQKTSSEWRRMTQVLDTCSEHRTFSIPAMRSADALKAVTDAVLSDAESSALALERGVEQVGSLALKGRLAKCEALLSKITTYDELLSTQLQCRSRIEELQASLVAAILKADTE